MSYSFGAGVGITFSSGATSPISGAGGGFVAMVYAAGPGPKLSSLMASSLLVLAEREYLGPFSGFGQYLLPGV